MLIISSFRMVPLLAAAFVALGVLGPWVSASGQAPGPSTVEDRVEAYLAEVVDGGAPGVSIAITRGDDAVLTTGAGMTSSGAPVTAGTTMRIASLSKSFTATAVMQLVDEGRVALDDPVQRHLPDFVLDDDRDGDITVRHLLNHSSGLSDVTSEIDEYRAGTETLEEAVSRLGEASLTAPPGEHFNYHNPNFHVAARLVEVVSGEPFDSYLRAHIFTPLGMTATTNISTAAEPVPGLAHGHTFAYGHPVAINGPDYFVSGAGGIVSTARDMARWLILQHGDGRTPEGQQIVSAESLAETHRRQAPDDYLYALGWYHGPSAEGGSVRTSHSGAAAGYGAYQGLFPNGFGISVLVNYGSALGAPNPYVIADALHRIATGEDADPAPVVHGVVRDMVATALGVLALAMGGLGVARSHRWARSRQRLRWALLRLLPPAVLAALITVLPSMQAWATGRSATWTVLFSITPVITIVLLTVAASAATVVIARAWWLSQVQRARRTSRLRASSSDRPRPSQW